MTLTQKLIVAFWVVIVLLAIYEFYTYNENLNEQAKAHPTPQHFFFYPPTNNAASAGGPNHKHATGADVVQTAFTVDTDSPSPGQFTCHVTLKNEGTAKALGVQVRVRPYRGVATYDADAGGNQKETYLDDDDPLSQFGQFLDFPDLAPGESATEDISFFKRATWGPGKNPNPEIVFESEKKERTIPRVPGGGG